MNERTDAFVNGALIALGAASILDNIFSHWLLGLHRAVPGSAATPVEVVLLLGGAFAVGVGIRREVRARHRRDARDMPTPTE
jgi:hypothetical protein